MGSNASDQTPHNSAPDPGVEPNLSLSVYVIPLSPPRAVGFSLLIQSLRVRSARCEEEGIRWSVEPSRLKKEKKNS